MRPPARSAAAGVAALLTALVACSFPADQQPPSYSQRTWTPGVSGVVSSSTAPATLQTPAGSTCSTSRQPTDVAAMNAWMTGLSGLPRWVSGDVGASVQLRDGRILWVFGDTVRAEAVTPRLVANSALITAGGCTAQVVPGTGNALIPAGSDGAVCWPASAAGWADGSGDTVLVSCSRIQRAEGLLYFTYLGLTLATFRVPEGGVPQLISVDRVTPDNPDPLQVNWGSALLVDGDQVIVYGTRLKAVGQSARAVLVARTPRDKVSDRTAWTYWNGAGWVADPSSATPVLTADEGVSQAFTVDKIGTVYVMVSKKGGDFSDTVALWTGPTAVGPWRQRVTVSVPYHGRDGTITYGPLAHPEITLGDGKLLVSVSRNLPDIPTLIGNPQLGRPMFIEMTLPPGA